MISATQTGLSTPYQRRAVRRAYADRKDQLATPERRRISNIVVETEDDALQVHPRPRSTGEELRGGRLP